MIYLNFSLLIALCSNNFTYFVNSPDLLPSQQPDPPLPRQQEALPHRLSLLTMLLPLLLVVVVVECFQVRVE